MKERMKYKRKWKRKKKTIREEWNERKVKRKKKEDKKRSEKDRKMGVKTRKCLHWTVIDHMTETVEYLEQVCIVGSQIEVDISNVDFQGRQAHFLPRLESLN